MQGTLREAGCCAAQWLKSSVTKLFEKARGCELLEVVFYVLKNRKNNNRTAATLLLVAVGRVAQERPDRWWGTVFGVRIDLDYGAPVLLG